MLSSWRAGAARQAIIDFVSAATAAGPSFVSVADRIATFDNDGTLWVEQPWPAQADFLFHTWAAEARQNPALAPEEPYRAIIEKDDAFFAALLMQDPEVVRATEQAVARSWHGTVPSVFDVQVREWLQTVVQPRFGVPYTALVYQPMRELIAYLNQNSFRVFVCSAGGRDFMRVFAEDTWGIFKENVIGTAPEYEFTDGTLRRTDRILGGLSLGPGKPEHIFARTGRMPVFAGGNGDVDIEMLTVSRFALLVNHDDPDREYAYTRGADRSLALAAERGWTVVSMRDDWSTMFPGGVSPHGD